MKRIVEWIAALKAKFFPRKITDAEAARAHAEFVAKAGLSVNPLLEHPWKKLAEDVARDFSMKIDWALKAEITKIEGKAPTKLEWAKNGYRIVMQDFTHETFVWKEQEVIRVRWWPKPGTPFLIDTQPFPAMDKKTLDKSPAVS